MKRIIKIIAICGIVIFLLLSVLIISVIIYSKDNIDIATDEDLFAAMQGELNTILYVDKSGAIEISKYTPEEYERIYFGEVRKWVHIEDIPPLLINSFIAVEDREYYNHNGVNLLRTAYAGVNHLFHIRNKFGASTITQQVIKNISGDNESSVKRKFNEIIRAYSLNKNHSKDEVLELYLNIIPMGNNIIGVGAAAEYYFGKEQSDLLPEEIALLIGLTNAPSANDPYKNPEKAIKKRNLILSVMKNDSLITEFEYYNGICADLNLNIEQRNSKNLRSFVAEMIIDDAAKSLSEKYGYSIEKGRSLIIYGGVKIYTTIDPEIQEIINNEFKSNILITNTKNEEWCMTVFSNEGCILRAAVGAKGEKSGNKVINYCRITRPPGSILKPLALYAPLIDSGKITFATVLDDVPKTVTEDENGYICYPKNSPNQYSGLINVRSALAKSKNTIAISLYEMLDAKEIYKHLKNDHKLSGLVSNNNGKTDLAPAPLALGQLTNGVTPEEITSAYTVFPNDGIRHTKRSFIAIYSNTGELILDNPDQAERIYSTDGARVMMQLLLEVTKNGTAKSVTLNDIIETGGKTGTSSNSRDKWFIGITPYYTAGIWRGAQNNDHSIMDSSHLAVWDEIMIKIHKDKESRLFSTEGLIRAPYCRDSGHKFTPDCINDPRGSRLEYGYFIKGTEPKDYCNTHKSYLVENKMISYLVLPERNLPKDIKIADSYLDVNNYNINPFYELEYIDKRKRN